jgi:FkbM family methyltransferase
LVLFGDAYSKKERAMSHSPAAVISRASRGIVRRCRQFRNTIEWRASHSLRKEAPWSVNRWGQRYQALSLTEYHYLRDGNPETYESLLIEKTIEPGMTVLDVGANHGLFSLEAASMLAGDGIVHAFEPTPSTRSLLEKNLAANDLAMVKVFPFAVGESPGTARLRVHHEWTGLNTLAGEDITWNHRTLHADEVIEVPVISLDDHAQAEGLDQIHFLKIDVEGFELGVIRGARGLLQNKRVKQIMLEIGDSTCRQAGVDPTDLVAELDSVGYDLFAMTPDGMVADRVRTFPETSFSANFVALPA